MKKILLLVIVAAVIIGIANSGAGGGTTAAEPAARPGSPAVYQQIAAETDCAALQATFDRSEANGNAARARGNLAMAKITTTYMGDADDRMRAIGCY